MNLENGGIFTASFKGRYELQTKESPDNSELSSTNIGIGNDLSSREATLRVLSALEVFTTVFGMGTGGILLLSHR